MTYVIQAVLSDPRRPACGQCTIPFPIPDDAYDDMIEMLGGIGIGDAVAKDCRIDAVDSFYGVLGSLTGTMVNVDELDYLAKRLDSFCDNEAEQFQAMAHKLELKDIKDFINLTFCCQRATVISDFSKLEQVGKGLPGDRRLRGDRQPDRPEQDPVCGHLRGRRTRRGRHPHGS